MKQVKPLKEFIIIAILLAVIISFVFLVIGVGFGNDNLDINLHDTYFVIQYSWIDSVFPPFLWLVAIVYVIRTVLNQYKSRLQNLILLIAFFGLNVLMLNYLKLAAKFNGFTSRTNWTIYPPLSALSKVPPHKNHISSFNNTTEIIFIIQIILLLLLVIIAVLTGKNWKSASNAS